MERTWHAIVTGERQGLAARAARWGLRLASVLYATGLAANHWIYDSGLKQRSAPALPVISLGNLTLGGTGKTTAARFVVEQLTGEARPAIVLRGYGRASSEDPLLVSDGQVIRADLREAGDEALMLARLLSGCAIAVGKKREKAIELLGERTDAQIVILDDGMQYFRMARALEIVLIDALADRRAWRLFPAGTLRESLSALRRADQVWITHADLATANELERLRGLIEGHNAGVAIIETRHKPGKIRPLAGDSDAAVSVEGRNVLAVSALGNPAAFEKSIESLGGHVTPMRFADHHQYERSDYERIAAGAREANAELVLTTEKDAVKLPPPPETCPAIGVIDCRLEIMDGREYVERGLRQILEDV